MSDAHPSAPPSEWVDLWRRWSEYERLWRDDKRAALLRLLMTSAPAKRVIDLAQWTGSANLPQPSPEQVAEILRMSDRVRVLQQEPHPDVYAAACAMKASSIWHANANGNHVYGFRGTRNAAWPLTPSIQRGVPSDPEVKQKELARRYHLLALFCEAMRMFLSRAGFDGQETTCMAIAQHYGVPSPLCDLTWSPWVALFFASHGGQVGDLGIVQAFSLSGLRELCGEGETGFGQLQIIEAEFVPRICAQQGFFIEFPAHRLDTQVIPVSTTFHQVPGLVFEDPLLGISESLIYPATMQDCFAGLERPRLQRFGELLEQRPTSTEQYLKHAKAWRPEMFADLPMAAEALLREACEFHCRLQSVPGLRDHERSITRFRTAIGRIPTSLQSNRLCDMDDIVGYYVSQAGSDSQRILRSVWEVMTAERGRALHGR